VAFITAFIITSFVLPSIAYAASNNTLLSNKPINIYSSSKLERWHDILDNHVSDTYNSQSINVKTWYDFIELIRDEPKLRQLMRVNMWFEQFPHKQDNWVYQKDDYWASPVEFLAKGGDCEDYAIIKYMTLRKLGFEAKDMKIAMVYDIYSGTDHSFLTVQHKDAEFVLDNREKLVVSRYMKNRYKPHFAFNENKLWVYDSPVMVQKMRADSKGTVMPGNR
jgi:predicted transglutaminase-like cysteine proteinase